MKDLNVKREEAEIEIIDDGKAGFLGFGSRNAKVKVTAKKIFVDKKEKETFLSKPSERPSVEKESPESSAESQEESLTLKEEEAPTDPQKAKEILSGIIERMGMEGMIESRTRDGRVVLNTIGKDSNLLIGKKGQTLDAVQLLVNLMYSKSVKKKANIVVDVEEYKVRREKRLQSIALEVRDKVKKTQKPIAIAPMNSQDRRIIHMTLQNDRDVKTASKGEGLLRKVVVIPKS